MQEEPLHPEAKVLVGSNEMRMVGERHVQRPCGGKQCGKEEVSTGGGER